MALSPTLRAFLNQIGGAATEGVSNILSDITVFKAAIEELSEAALEVQDDEVVIVSSAVMNFKGAGVVVTDVAGVATVTISGGAGGALDFEEEGAAVVTSTTLNAVGSGVTITDVAGVATITVPGTIEFQEEGVRQNDARVFNVVGIGGTLADVAGVATLTIPGTQYQEEGANVVESQTLNFVGSAVTLSNILGVATVTITGGLTAWEEEGAAVVSSATFNAVGAGATLTDVGGIATLTIPGELPLIMVEHIEATTINAAGGAAGVWTIRKMTTIRKNTITGASLATNQITLPAGDYRVKAWQEAFRVNGCQGRVRDTTGAADLVLGMSALSDTGTDGDPVTLNLDGYFTIGVESVLEFQMFAVVQNAASGMGAAGSSGASEIFANIMIEKLD